MKTIHLTALLLLLALGLIACSRPPGPLHITLLAEDISWSTDIIAARPGQPIELTIRNQGILDHDFVLDELGVDILLSPGQSETITLIVDEAGRYEFICSIPGHQDAGMVGEIVIGAAP